MRSVISPVERPGLPVRGLSKGGRPLTGMAGLSQGDRTSYREAGPLTDRPVRSQGGQASHRKPSLSQGWLASHREAMPLTRRLGLSQGGQASHRVAGPLTGRLGFQGGRVCHMKARPLIERPGLSQSILFSITHKSQHFVLCNKKAKKNYLVGIKKSFWPRSAVPAFQRFLIAWL